MIRSATPADQDAIAEIAVDSGLFSPLHLDDFREMLPDQLDPTAPQHMWLIDEHDGRAIAAAYCAPEPLTDGTFNLYFIAVRKQVQGGGHGSALLAAIEKSLRAVGARNLIIETSGVDGFEATRRFYLKHGYREEARIPEFYSAGDDKVVFWRKLK